MWVVHSRAFHGQKNKVKLLCNTEFFQNLLGGRIEQCAIKKPIDLELYENYSSHSCRSVMQIWSETQ